MPALPCDESKTYAFFDCYKFSQSITDGKSCVVSPVKLSDSTFTPIILTNSKHSANSFHPHFIRSPQNLYLLDRCGIHRYTSPPNQKDPPNYNFSTVFKFPSIQRGEGISACFPGNEQVGEYAAIQETVLVCLDGGSLIAIDLNKGSIIFTADLSSSDGFSDIAIECAALTKEGDILLSTRSYKEKADSSSNEKEKGHKIKVLRIDFDGTILDESEVKSSSRPLHTQFIPKTNILLIITHSSDEDAGLTGLQRHNLNSDNGFSLNVETKEGKKFNEHVESPHFWPDEVDFDKESSLLHFIDCFRISKNKLLLLKRQRLSYHSFLGSQIGPKSNLSEIFLSFSSGTDAIITRICAKGPLKLTFSHVDTFPALAQIAKTREQKKLFGFFISDGKAESDMALVAEHSELCFFFGNPRGAIRSWQKVLQMPSESILDIAKVGERVLVLSLERVWVFGMAQF